MARAPPARVSGRLWHLYTLPEHLFFFSRESLRRLLAQHGFEILRLRAESSYYTLGYAVAKLRKVLFGPRAPRRAKWPGEALCVPLNLFDIVTAVAARASGRVEIKLRVNGKCLTAPPKLPGQVVLDACASGDAAQKWALQPVVPAAAKTWALAAGSGCAVAGGAAAQPSG